MSAKKILFIIGRPFSFFYAIAMNLRAFLYSSKIFKSIRPSVPVISVGNLTLGGTGKTPVSYYISKLLVNNGYTPAIISRGYSGKANQPVNIVSNKQDVLLPPELAGDEPYMLANMLKGVPVVTGKKRIVTSKYAIKHLDANILILDDGFQHLPVQRDCNLALFDSQIGFGNNRVFPGGDLRESHSALSRASAFVITGKNASDISLPIYHQLSKLGFNKPIFSLTRIGSQFFDADSNIIDNEDIPKSCHSFCGIANPDRFFHDLGRVGINIKNTMAFPDHHIYTQKDADMISLKANKFKMPALITTEKDFVKLKNFNFTVKLYYVRPMYSGSKNFDDFILSFLSN